MSATNATLAAVMLLASMVGQPDERPREQRVVGSTNKKRDRQKAQRKARRGGRKK